MKKEKNKAIATLEPLPKDNEAVARVIAKFDATTDIHCEDGKIVARGDEALAIALLLDEFGVSTPAEVYQMIDSATAGASARNKDKVITKAISLLREFAPKTVVERMLVSQMIAVDRAVMLAMDRQMLPLATKLQRTFLMQVEALQKIKGSAQQRVSVEHVHIYPGGQAVVGNVNSGGLDKNGTIPHA